MKNSCNHQWVKKPVREKQIANHISETTAVGCWEGRPFASKFYYTKGQKMITVTICSKCNKRKE